MCYPLRCSQCSEFTQRVRKTCLIHERAALERAQQLHIKNVRQYRETQGRLNCLSEQSTSGQGSQSSILKLDIDGLDQHKTPPSSQQHQPKMSGRGMETLNAPPGVYSLGSTLFKISGPVSFRFLFGVGWKHKQMLSNPSSQILPNRQGCWVLFPVGTGCSKGFKHWTDVHLESAGLCQGNLGQERGGHAGTSHHRGPIQNCYYITACKCLPQNHVESFTITFIDFPQSLVFQQFNLPPCRQTTVPEKEKIRL